MRKHLDGNAPIEPGAGRQSHRGNLAARREGFNHLSRRA